MFFKIVDKYWEIKIKTKKKLKKITCKMTKEIIVTWYIFCHKMKNFL